MKKIYSILFMLVALVATVNAASYKGTLDITMMGSEIAKGQATVVDMNETEDGNYTFVLPDFSVTIGETVLPLGDIVVENVTRIDENGDGTFEIAGMVEDLALPNDPSIADEEKIHAKVEIAGTETSEGAMDLNIVVGWYTDYPNDLTQTMPIDVKFVGQKKEDIGAVVDTVSFDGLVYGANGVVVVNGYEGTVVVYDFAGRLVKSAQVAGNAEIALTKGLYIVRTGTKAAKVVVK